MTIEDFRRTGLSHLLAVTGQNVALLALLAVPALGALGIPLRTRLVWLLGLIAVDLPLAGAGPSIQRAGVMGALAFWRPLPAGAPRGSSPWLSRRRPRWPWSPAVAADVGWQLSFAAVLGILLLSTPLREAIVARLGARAGAGPSPRARR